MTAASSQETARLVALLARLIVGCVLALAVSGKLISIEPLTVIIAGVLALPAPTDAMPHAIALVALEAAMAVWLLSGRASRWSLASAAILLLAMTGVILAVRSELLDLGCGCGLGRVFPGLTHRMDAVIRNSGLVLIALVGAVASRSRTLGAVPAPANDSAARTSPEPGDS